MQFGENLGAENQRELCACAAGAAMHLCGRFSALSAYFSLIFSEPLKVLVLNVPAKYQADLTSLRVIAALESSDNQ